MKGGEAGPDLPTLDFSTFVLSIIGSAYVHLGDAPNPDGQPERNQQLARQDIDLLGLLQEKTWATSRAKRNACSIKPSTTF